MNQARRRSHRGASGNTSESGNRGALRATLRAAVVLTAAGLLAAGGVAWSIASRGLSAHAEPSRAEEALAGLMRRWATPRAVRTRANPVPPSGAVLGEALEHFADHCALCHANDGSGRTTIGRGMYPKVPDMRAADTQSLTDGELFSIIEHGIRLTGMPGWGNGTAESERESWGLVHFIRRLPALTPEELGRMDALNPRSPAQFRAEEAARRFLEGDSGQPAAAPRHGHQD